MKLRLPAAAVGALLLAGVTSGLAQADEPTQFWVTQDSVRATFAKLDADKDQFITSAEAPRATRRYTVQGVMHVQGPSPAIFILQHDRDGDGRVSLVEYEQSELENPLRTRRTVRSPGISAPPSGG